MSSPARIKLLWDFHGPDSKKIAEHHAIHLNEFAEREQLENTLTGVETIAEMHCVAYLVVNQEKMIVVRDALKPHRGQVFNQ